MSSNWPPTKAQFDAFQAREAIERQRARRAFWFELAQVILTILGMFTWVAALITFPELTAAILVATCVVAFGAWLLYRANHRKR